MPSTTILVLRGKRDCRSACIEDAQQWVRRKSKWVWSMTEYGAGSDSWVV